MTPQEKRAKTLEELRKPPRGLDPFWWMLERIYKGEVGSIYGVRVLTTQTLGPGRFILKGDK